MSVVLNDPFEDQTTLSQGHLRPSKTILIFTLQFIKAELQLKSSNKNNFIVEGVTAK